MADEFYTYKGRLYRAGKAAPGSPAWMVRELIEDKDAPAGFWAMSPFIVGRVDAATPEAAIRLYEAKRGGETP